MCPPPIFFLIVGHKKEKGRFNLWLEGSAAPGRSHPKASLTESTLGLDIGRATHARGTCMFSPLFNIFAKLHPEQMPHSPHPIYISCLTRLLLLRSECSQWSCCYHLQAGISLVSAAESYVPYDAEFIMESTFPMAVFWDPGCLCSTDRVCLNDPFEKKLV